MAPFVPHTVQRRLRRTISEDVSRPNFSAIAVQDISTRCVQRPPPGILPQHVAMNTGSDFSSSPMVATGPS
jgi:hypothetical protein